MHQGTVGRSTVPCVPGGGGGGRDGCPTGTFCGLRRREEVGVFLPGGSARSSEGRDDFSCTEDPFCAGKIVWARIAGGVRPLYRKIHFTEGSRPGYWRTRPRCGISGRI